MIGLVSSSNGAATAAAGDDYDGGGSDVLLACFRRERVDNPTGVHAIGDEARCVIEISVGGNCLKLCIM